MHLLINDNEQLPIMQTLTVNNVEIQVERKPIKNLHLSVYPPDGRVHVSAPLLYSDERIQLYINKKWAWITAKRAALTSFNIQSPREYVSGEAHYFMGQLYTLKVERDGRFPQHVEIVGDYITVTVRPQAEPQHIESVLYAWYKEQLTPVISGMVEKYSEKLGVAPDHWEVRKMAARWGSCSTTKKKILFNIELAKNLVLYLAYYFRCSDRRSLMTTLAQGSSKHNLSKDNFLNLPSSKVGKTAIANVLNDLDEEIAALEAKRAKYEQVKQGMMQELLTGRIRLIKE